MAIISASRRTDIPSYHSEWFIRRLEEKRVGIRNPYNPNQVSLVPLNGDVIDCIVFWTKNAIPMTAKMSRLDKVGIPYYFQYTITPYGKDMEARLPDKNLILKNFKELSDKCNGHTIWRYDPIVFTKDYTIGWHLEQFERMARELKGYTEKCVISFVDAYQNNLYANETQGVNSVTKEMLEDFCTKLSTIAKNNGMKVGTCAEVVDLQKCGIEHNSCIDKDYIEKIIGCRMNVDRDKTQRSACGCVESIDVGTYNTCMNGCAYCYACKRKEQVKDKMSKKNDDSLLLCDEIHEWDKITEKNVSSFKDNQLSIFDFINDNKPKGDER